MKTPHIITPTSIVAFIAGESLSIAAGTEKYKLALNALDKNDEDAFLIAFTKTEKEVFSESVSDEGFIVDGDKITVDGLEVFGPLKEKLQRMVKEGHNIDHLKEFVRNLHKNPSRSSVAEAYDFLAYAELPITDKGTFLAYKGIQDDYYSCTAGTITLKKGKQENKKVFNGIGEEIECDRIHVDDDRRNSCSNGLHVGSFKYANDFGAKTVLVEVNPKDIVSVPTDCSCQKMRVSAYKVIEDCSGEINDAVVSSGSSQAVETERSLLAEKIDDRVSSLLKKGEVTIRRVQSALSPECPSLHTIRDILINELGYSVSVDPDNKTAVGFMKVS